MSRYICFVIKLFFFPIMIILYRTTSYKTKLILCSIIYTMAPDHLKQKPLETNEIMAMRQGNLQIVL